MQRGKKKKKLKRAKSEIFKKITKYTKKYVCPNTFYTCIKKDCTF